MLRLKVILPEQQHSYNEGLIEFEKNFSYPLGNERFVISHGKNYFRFFNELGNSTHFLALDGEKIVATASMILREVCLAENNIKDNLYYICDLKILPEYRGRNLVQEFKNFALKSEIIKSDKFYSISMDDSKFKENKLLKLTSRIMGLNLQFGGKIYLYLLDRNTLTSISVDLYQHFGAYSFQSLSGVKDLILESNKKPLQFVHLIRGTEPNVYDSDDVKFMFCLPDNAELVDKLRLKNVECFASASILQRNLHMYCWDFITTAEL